MMTEQMKFEEAIKELEATVKAMENGDLGLDELLADFEKGIGLLRLCEKKLAEAENRIAVLTREEIAAAEPAADDIDADVAAVFADDAEETIPEDELPF